VGSKPSELDEFKILAFAQKRGDEARRVWPFGSAFSLMKRAKVSQDDGD